MITDGVQACNRGVARFFKYFQYGLVEKFVFLKVLLRYTEKILALEGPTVNIWDTSR